MTLIFRSSPVAQKIKNLPAMQETWVRSLGQEDLMGKGMATHSSILAWRIPWTEEPGGSWSMGLQTVNMTEQLTHDINFQVYYDAFFLFKKIIFNRRIIALQYCVLFCHTSTWISHRYTHVPSFLNLPPTPPTHPTPLGCHREAFFFFF